MTSRLTPLAAVAALALGALCGGAEDGPWQVELMGEALVSGETVRLADVSELGEDVPEAVREIPLGNAPWPGWVREVSIELVKVRLVSAGFPIERFDFSGSSRCAVSLDSLEVAADLIAAAAREHVAGCFPEGGPDVEIELVREVTPVKVPAAGGVPELRASYYGSGAPVGTVRVDVDLVRDGERLKRVPVSLLVRIHDQVAVSRRNISTGEELSEANADLVRRDVTALSGSYLRTLEALSGKAAARPILAGQALTERNTREAEKPVVIERNQRVFLVVETSTLRAVTLGKALERARLGEVARAENLSTGREVAGIAVAKGKIMVPIGRQVYVER